MISVEANSLNHTINNSGPLELNPAQKLLIKVSRGSCQLNNLKSTPNGTNHVSNSIQKAIQFLERKATLLYSYQSLVGNHPDLSDAVEMPMIETFSSAIIYDLIKTLPISPKIINNILDFIKSCATPETGTFNFFAESGIIPDDVDCTGVALWALLDSKSVVPEKIKSCAQYCVNNTNKSTGIIETYLPPFKDRTGRFCSVALCNMMRAIYASGLEAKDTEDYLYNVLQNKLYLGDDAVLYYPQKWHFFYYLKQCIDTNEKAKSRFISLLRERVKYGFSTDESISEIERAMRVILGHQLGLYKDDEFVRKTMKGDIEILLKGQFFNGGWKPCVFHTNGKGVKFYFGSECMTTAFVVRALDMHNRLDWSSEVSF